MPLDGPEIILNGGATMPTDLACKPCKGTGDELEDSMSTLGIPGGMVPVAPCLVCGGSGIAAWAVEAGANSARFVEELVKTHLARSGRRGDHLLVLFVVGWELHPGQLK